MRPRKLSFLLGWLLVCATTLNAAEGSGTWLEVRSPHFTVVTNGNEKQARRVLEQFEQIRGVFRLAFPRLRIDTSAPIYILAAKDEKAFAALAPPAWEKRGQLRRAGLFLQGPEKNYVLLRLDLRRDDLFESVFHEYTHAVMHQNVKSLPLWLDEGLAGFYGHTRILDKEIQFGYPSETYVRILRDSVSLPLETLLQVDHSSPYYNEQNKGSIFYAQSWALTHYLMLKFSQTSPNALPEFLTLLDRGVETIEAATQAFGDLGKLRRELDSYIRASGFYFRRLRTSVRDDEMELQARPLSPAEAAAWRGDFLAHQQRYTEARAVLEEALQQGPSIALAHESMGFIELREKHLDAARKCFTEAVRLDSRSYFAHYYFAAMNLQAVMEGEEGEAENVEESLRAAMAINPEFAPTYDALAAFYAMRGEQLEEAHKLALQAVQLEPGNARFRVTTANVLMRQERVVDALRVLELALPMAKSPQEKSYVEANLESARKYQELRAEVQRREAQERAEAEEFRIKLEEERKRRLERARQEEAEAAAAVTAAEEARGMPAGAGASRAGWSAGKIVAVSCKASPEIEITLQGALSRVRLHSGNYFKIEFLTGTWKPPDPFNPCQHLEGRQAAISYRTFDDSPYDGEIVSIEIRK